jgi:hypothetical protein
MESMEDPEAELNKQYYLINKILDDVYQIFNLIKPSIIRMAELKDSVLSEHTENFRQAALKLIEISKLCKEIEDRKDIFEIRKEFEKTSHFS